MYLVCVVLCTVQSCQVSCLLMLGLIKYVYQLCVIHTHTEFPPFWHSRLIFGLKVEISIV